MAMPGPEFPDDSDVHRAVQTILGYYELEMWDEALAEAGEAEERLGTRTELDELRIVILQEAKRWGEMRQAAEHAARREPTRASWFISWAYALRREQSIAEARKVLELAHSLHPGEALIPFNLACYAAQTGKLAEARVLLDKAVGIDPELRRQAEADPDLAPLRGEAQRKVPPSKEAKSRESGIKAKAAKAAASAPKPPASGKVASKKASELAALAEALHAVTRKLVEGDSNSRAKALHALVEARAEAILVALMAIEQPGIAPLAMRALWECWLNEEGPQARTEIERGITRMDKADYASAEEVFAQLIVHFPKWAEPINKLATVYYLQKRYEESLALCRQVVRMKPDHFGAWQGIGLCAAQLGQWETALEAARNALRLQPKNATCLEQVRLLEGKVGKR